MTLLDIEEYEQRKMPRGMTRLKWHIILNPFSALILLVLFANILIIVFVLIPWSNDMSEEMVAPYNSLERDTVSKTHSLVVAYKAVKMIATIHKNCPGEPLNTVNRQCAEGLYEEGEDFTEAVHRAKQYVLALEAVGMLKDTEVDRILPGFLEHKAAQEFSVVTPQEEVFNRSLLCYENGQAWGNKKYPVDVSLCEKLEMLFADIKTGRKPPLLTVFTWWPGPIYDIQKFSRKAFYKNLDMLRPFVQPVLFTNDRNNMAIANVLDWPCFPVPQIGPDGKPLFKPMAEMVKEHYKSTFYGYVEASTLFDVSLLQTLITAIEQLAIPSVKGDNMGTPDAEEKETNSFIMTGRSWYSENPGFPERFTDLHDIINPTKLFKMNPYGLEDARHYLIYSGVDFSPMPDLTLDGYYLGKFVTKRANLLANLVVNSTFPLWNLHIIRNKTHSEWNREYIRIEGPEPFYNRMITREAFMIRRTPGRTTLNLQAKFVPGYKIVFETEREAEERQSGPAYPYRFRSS